MVKESRIKLNEVLKNNYNSKSPTTYQKLLLNMLLCPQQYSASGEKASQAQSQDKLEDINQAWFSLTSVSGFEVF